MLQEIGNEVRLGGQLKHEHFGTICRDFGALHRVIIYKNETIETELKFARERFKIFRLRLPVETPGSKMFAAQGPIASLAEDLKHIRLVILAAQTKEHAR